VLKAEVVPFNPTKDKDFDVETWVRKTVNAHALLHLSTSQKVPWSIQKMEAAAETAWYNEAEKIRTEFVREPMWEDLKQWVLRTYLDPTREFKAREAIKTLRQSGEIREYVAAFEKNVAAIPLARRPSEADLVHEFTKGLEASLRELCAYDRVMGIEWRSFEECKRQALAQGVRLEASRAKFNRGGVDSKKDHSGYGDKGLGPRKSGTPNGGSSPKFKRPHKKPFTPSPLGQSVKDRLGPRVPNLDNKLRRQLAKDGKCFQCKKPGHTARECPEARAPHVGGKSVN